MNNQNKFYIVIDTETSSFKIDEGEVLQLSALKIDSKSGEIIDVFDHYLAPTEKCDFNPFSMRINGISKALLNKADNRKDTFIAFNKFVEGADCIMGYNLSFDINMIDDDILKEGVILFNGEKVKTHDVMSDVSNIETCNHKLETVARYLGFDCEFHNSFFDCLATNFVFRKINKLPIPENSEIVNQHINKASFKYSSQVDYFKGKNVCVTGDFCNCSREKIESIITELGGIMKSGISKKVNILIDGYNEKETGKEKKAKELIASGSQIEIMNENTFMSIVCC